MPKTERQRQKKLAKKRTKVNKERRELSRKKNILNSLSGRVQAMSNRPLAIAAFGEGAYSPTGMSSVLLGRTMPDGQIMLAVWMVDMGCLGVKDAYCRILSKSTFTQAVEKLSGSEGLVKTNPATILALLTSANEYCSRLGFTPHADGLKLLNFLGDVDVSESREVFQFAGDVGKPEYISGPFDTPEFIESVASTLTESCGPDGFTYVVRSTDSMLGTDSDDAREQVQELPSFLSLDRVTG